MMKRFRAPNGWATNASVFDKKGNPWMSEADRLNDRSSRVLVKGMSDEALAFAVKRAQVLNRMHSQIGGKVRQADYTETEMVDQSNPDWDAYFAARAPPDRDVEKIGIGKPCQPPDPSDHRKRVNALLAMKAKRKPIVR